ncbi:MAG TPA: class I SAM-dependent methyltransferase [Stellaceae bacterium]|nr:class I SAM-dependent methyltransferase [Stellaceae bacterium]
MAPSREALLDERESLLAEIAAVYGTRQGLSETISLEGFLWVDAAVEAMALKGPTDYLEIGSFMGVSTIVFASALRRRGVLGRIVCLDPYFDQGYVETLPWGGETVVKNSTPYVMAKACELYARCGLEVYLNRQESRAGLQAIISGGKKFGLVFIDGNHEGLNPLCDLALSLCVIAPGGFVVLDDVAWPDVAPVKALCDRHLVPVLGSPQKACYQAVERRYERP